MTKPFTPKQKYLILVNFGAVVVEATGVVLSIVKATYGSDTSRFQQLRRIERTPGRAVFVKCACGCEVWERLSATDFDHDDEYANNKQTVTSNGRPLRRDPCHRAKTSAFAAITGKVVKQRRKLSVTARSRGEAPPANPAQPPRRSWPTRPLSHPTLKRRFDGRVERRIP